MTKTEQLPSNITIRSYAPGDETQIVDLLNICYGEWGDVTKWHGLYTNYPTFATEDVFIIEDGDEIIGHRGLHYRDLVVNQIHRVPTVSLGDTAVHHRYQGHGLYGRLHRATLQAAESKGACLALTWNLKGSTTYNHNRNTGFVVVQQRPAYMKVINPERVLRSGVSDFLHKNRRMRNTLWNLGTDLRFRVGDAEFSITQLVQVPDLKSRTKEGKVTLVFSEDAVSLLGKFRASSGFERAMSVLLLVLRRKVRIRFSSARSFCEVARKGVAIVGSL